MASNSSDINSSAVTVVNQGGTVNTGDINIYTEATSPENFDLPPLIKSFTGRDKEMKQLDALFFNKDKKKVQNKVVICGFGGIGKSELAKQFAKKCQDDGRIEDIYWINSETKTQLKKSAKKVKGIYKEMNGKKCLFILDNGISRKKLAECQFELPDEFFFIVTSQEQDWGFDIISIQLDSLDLQFALDFYKTNLKDYYKDEDRESLIKLAELVGCIPLGLQITAAHVHQAKRIYGDNYLQAYVKKLEKSQSEIIEIDFPSSADNSYDKSVYEAITVSLNKFADYKDTKNPVLALWAVYVCSYLDPEYIDFDDLLEVLNSVEELSESDTIDKDKLKEALFLLNNLSLVSYDPNDAVINMHRFVQEVLRYHLKNHDTVMQKNCYVACLKCCLSHYYIDTRDSVFQYADENITVLKLFYFTLNDKIVKFSLAYDLVLHKICDALIQYECIISLEFIFEDLGARAKEYIIEFSLLNNAAGTCNKTNILDLFLKYVHVNIKDITYYNNTPLHAAASTCNIEAIKYLLDRGADINSRNKEGNTPLFEYFKFVPCCIRFDFNQVQMFFKLLKLNDNIHLTNSKGETYLHIVRSEYLMEYLIKKYHVNVNVQDSKQKTPLHTALYKLNSGCLDTNLRNIILLIMHGAILNIKDWNGMTPIALAQHYKIETNLIAFFFKDRFTEQLRKLFHEFGDQKVIKIINDFKLLHRAMEDNQADILNLLLEYDIYIHTKLILLLYNGRYIEQLRKVFKKFGDRKVIKIINESKLLHRAIDDNQADVLNLLLEYDIDVNIKNDKLQTPLHIAIEHWNFNVILELLQYECDDNENAMNKYKHTLLHVAAMSCHADLVDILTGKYKLDVNALDIDGNTPLHCLIDVQIKRRHSKKDCDVIEAVQKFKAHGARLDIKNNKGLTPFEYATQEKVEFLLPYLVDRRRKHRKCECIIL